MPDQDRDAFNLQEAFEYGRAAIQTSLAINGGGAVAILAFFGSALATPGGVTTQFRAAVAASLACFACGVFLSALTFGVGYIVQLLWGGNHPFGTAERRERIAQRLQSAALILVVISLFSFLAGTFWARSAVLSPTTTSAATKESHRAISPPNR
jgi:hypothetical protein